MIAGFGGELVSHAYLEQHVLPAIDRSATDVFERAATRWWRHVARTLGPASSARAIHDTAVVPLLQLLGHARPVSQPDACGMRSTLGQSDAIVLSIPWNTVPHAAWRDAIRHGAGTQSSWALISNGRALRMVDCRRAWTRAAVEFDFETLMLSPAGIDSLHALASAASLGGRGATSFRARIAASDEHASAVCRSISDGVLDALPSLASALKGARRQDAFDQALTVVYRILFLLFAEARSLVPIWHELYRDAYTIEHLTRRAAQGHSTGLWQGLQAISRLAHAGCSAGDLSVTAFNGRLFSPHHTPLAEQRRIPDAMLRDILLSLATTATKDGIRRRVSYHDLGVEQLGTVYERVLEYEPRPNGALARTSTQRKSTGSFYTPQSLTDFIVRRTLAPLVDGKSCDDILKLRIVDPAMGSAAFLVAACRHLADCCEQALMRDGEWRAGETTRARATLRRLVAERCLYGVDLNPTAVQLARVSLWLTTLAADRPLTLLDHHLASGNSLVGAWLADLSAPPRSSKMRSSLPLFDDQVGADIGACLPARLQLAMEPSDSVAIVRKKERALADLARDDSPLSKWSAACDAWCAAALWRESPPSEGLVREWIAFATGLSTSLPGAQLRASLAGARAVAARHAAFHWELAFPEVFFGADGRPAASSGFDAVIGNPPWDMLRADTGSADDRKGSRATTSAALRFFRACRGYPHQGSGHPNRYQLFVERALRLTKPGGRIGLLLPSGIATDHGSAALRRQLFDRTTIDTWLGFENRRRIFPIHRSVRFVVLSTTNAGQTETLRYRCGLDDPDALHRPDVLANALSLSRSRIETLNPDLNIPEVTGATALSILTSIADHVPALGDSHGWNVRFGRELNATDDRPHFQKLNGDGGLLPIVEGKQLSPFQVDLGRSILGIPPTAAARLIDRATSFDRNRIAYRDVASATNKLTLIAAMLPAGTISTHTVFCLKTPLDDRSQWALLGLLNSFVANYLVRLNVTTHVTASIMSRLRVPKPAEATLEHLAALARQLARSGIEDTTAYAQLNSISAKLYGVTTNEYEHVLASFPLIASSVRERCLIAFVQ